jgi:hypothetical protein
MVFLFGKDFIYLHIKIKVNIMKNLIYVLLGALLILSTSVTTATIMTTRPATPKYFVVKAFYDGPKEQSDYIRKMMKDGWILKSQSLCGRQYSTQGIVVMEKY